MPWSAIIIIIIESLMLGCAMVYSLFVTLAYIAQIRDNKTLREMLLKPSLPQEEVQSAIAESTNMEPETEDSDFPDIIGDER